MVRAQQIRNRRTSGGIGGWINFVGDEWTERNQDLKLATAAKRGETSITLTDVGPLGAGDYIEVRAHPENGWKGMAANLVNPARNQYLRGTAVNGNTLQLDVPIRFDSAPIGITTIRRIHPIRNVGIRKIHFEQLQTPGSEWHWLSFVGTSSALIANALFTDITGENGGRDMLWLSNCKDVTISDSDLLWSAHPSTAGASGYFGYQNSFDSLIENVSVIGHRHGPNVQGGSEIVVRDVWTDGGDTQLHILYAYDLIWENAPLIQALFYEGF
ncbi:MAG: hypothetical protein ACFCU3_03270 [Verrucomicrobiales bacterium]